MTKRDQANYFAGLSKTPIICGMEGRKILDGSGHPSLEVTLLCTVKNIDKPVCSAGISANSGLLPLASYDAIEASDNERVKSVETAIEWIIHDLRPLIHGISPNEQSRIDHLLSEYFKQKREELKEMAQVVQDVTPSPAPSIPTPTASPKSGKKKGSGKDKRKAVMEKPVPPEEPSEPVICGSFAIGAVSLAVAKSSAALNNVPLYLHVATLRNVQLPAQLVMPTPLISLLSYGKSSPGKLNLMKEVIVIPKQSHALQENLDMILSLQNQIMKQLCNVSKAASVIKNISPLGCLVSGCDRIDQPLHLIVEACEHLGLELGTDIHIALNCAAHELMDYNKGKYEVISGTFKTPDEMVDMYLDLINQYPSVIALLDPLRKEDAAQWQSLANALASKCYLISDVASKPVSRLLDSRNVNIPLSSGTVIKHTNETTVSDLLDICNIIAEEKRVAILGCLDEESMDESLADLAIGLGARFIKLGGLLRGEKTTKYNRLLAIEDKLRRDGTLGYHQDYEFPALSNEMQISASP
ncbi:enolase 4 isoform X1 [Pelobates cultripes]|uniref:phosphopyruvate hydratase n=1 Tax=Pelobates cultripes TaxID=61616 RepID=A0AAD1WRP3_PELCU|nr:enolase 4 isoform X1 [Pelobates cultripes]